MKDPRVPGSFGSRAYLKLPSPTLLWALTIQPSMELMGDPTEKKVDLGRDCTVEVGLVRIIIPLLPLRCIGLRV